MLVQIKQINTNPDFLLQIKNLIIEELNSLALQMLEIRQTQQTHQVDAEIRFLWQEHSITRHSCLGSQVQALITQGLDYEQLLINHR